ncbi:MAG TPA: DUF1294 domain-containing protein [Verrucomicrobiae bacterium]|nr:DUF1294 domain-containing protein [Verrucomicrobiae bacterium]
MSKFYVILLGWNFLTFLLMGYDKLIAGSKVRRVPERVLLLAAAGLGAPGVFAAMQMFRHKTLHAKFKFGVPVLVVLNCVVVYMMVKQFGISI